LQLTNILRRCRRLRRLAALSSPRGAGGGRHHHQRSGRGHFASPGARGSLRTGRCACGLTISGKRSYMQRCPRRTVREAESDGGRPIGPCSTGSRSAAGRPRATPSTRSPASDMDFLVRQSSLMQQPVIHGSAQFSSALRSDSLSGPDADPSFSTSRRPGGRAPDGLSRRNAHGRSTNGTTC